MMDSNNARLDQIYTADEAAEKLRLTRRAVITNGKRYGLCLEVGRQVRFTEGQLIKLVEAMQYKPVSSIGGRYLAAYESGMALGRLRARAEWEAKARQQKQEDRRAKLTAERAERQAAEAQKREARLAEKRRIATEKREAKADKAIRRAEQAALPIDLDSKNRDPEYWTDERKRALRQERLARVQARGIK